MNASSHAQAGTGGPGGLRVLVIGGSTHHPGGIEAFCERSAIALDRRGGWRIRRVPANTAYLTIATLPRLLTGLARLVREASRQRPDCVWLQYGNFPDLLYLLVARMLGLRVMVTPHLGIAWRSQRNPLLRAAAAAMLRAASRLALISPTQEVELLLPSAVPRSAIRNFLPETILAAGPAVPPVDEGRMLEIVHCGRLSEGKGTFRFVEVCAGLRDRGVPFRARITGGAEPELYARLERAIADRGLADRVILHRRILESDLETMLRESHVLVHLSSIDSYPLIVLEAMACGAVPVCMELPGVRDQVESYTGMIVPVSDAVAGTVDWIAAQSVAALRTRGRDAAVTVRRDYAWSRCAAAVDAALRACIGRSSETTSPPAIDAP